MHDQNVSSCLYQLYIHEISKHFQLENVICIRILIFNIPEIHQHHLISIPEVVFPGDALPATFPTVAGVLIDVTPEAGFATAINSPPPPSFSSTCDYM